MRLNQYHLTPFRPPRSSFQIIKITSSYRSLESHKWSDFGKRPIFHPRRSKTDVPFPQMTKCPFSTKLATQKYISKVFLERYFRGGRLPWDLRYSKNYTHRDMVCSDIHSKGRSSGRSWEEYQKVLLPTVQKGVLPWVWLMQLYNEDRRANQTDSK